MSEQAERALDQASGSDWPDEHGDVRGQAHAGLGDLNPFTVVAPPRGSIQGNWQIEGLEDGGLSGGTDLDESLDIGPDEDEVDTEPAWPDEDLEEEEDDQDEEVPWPGEEDHEEPEEEDLVEAEAEAEQDEEEWADEDEEFWEDLLEDEEEDEEASEEEEPWPDEDEEDLDDDEPIFEDAGDWLEEDEPATEGERAQEERDAWIEESLEEEEEEAEPEEEGFDDLLADVDEDEDEEVEFGLAGGGEDDEEEELEFGLAEDDNDEGNPTVGAETLAADDEPEPAEHEDAYTHGPYTLYRKTVEGSEGETEDLFFFARNPPDDAEAAELPDDHEVGVNDRTGVPFVREANEDE